MKIIERGTAPTDALFTELARSYTPGQNKPPSAAQLNEQHAEFCRRQMKAFNKRVTERPDELHRAITKQGDDIARLRAVVERDEDIARYRAAVGGDDELAQRIAIKAARSIEDIVLADAERADADERHRQKERSRKSVEARRERRKQGLDALDELAMRCAKTGMTANEVWQEMIGAIENDMADLNLEVEDDGRAIRLERPGNEDRRISRGSFDVILSGLRRRS